MIDAEEEQLRHEILLVMKANDIPVSGDFWLRLAFLSKESLTAIADELHIPKRHWHRPTLISESYNNATHSDNQHQ